MYFDSNFGKTEMWLVLATRENAKISFGFKSKITKEDFIRAIEESKENKSAMDSLLYEIPVKKGDVFLIPAKAVHAIGAGCMILEVQEPTDFTIQPEYWCGDYRLNDYEMYLGLSQENALKVFDFNIFGNIGDKIARKYPKIIEETQDYIYESLVFYDDTPCFSVNRYHIKKSAVLKQAPAIYIITEGEGVLEGEGTTTRIKKGDYFFLPYCNKNQFQIKGEAQAVECLPRCK